MLRLTSQGRAGTKLKIKSPICFWVLFVLSFNSFACAISPIHLVATEPEKYFKENNLVFFGEIISMEQLPDETQVADFQVLKLFKGDSAKMVRVINQYKNSCSTGFVGVGKRYYVFGNITNEEMLVDLDGFPSFVPEQKAEKEKLLEKLPKAQ